MNLLRLSVDGRLAVAKTASYGQSSTRTESRKTGAQEPTYDIGETCHVHGDVDYRTIATDLEKQDINKGIMDSENDTR